MPDNSNKIKLAQQVVAAHRSKLASASDKDQVRRSIDAAQKRLSDLQATHTPQVFNDRRSAAGPRVVNDADHAVLDRAWQKSFSALKASGLKADADHPVAAAYRAASNAVNHANRSRDFSIATGRSTAGKRSKKS